LFVLISFREWLHSYDEKFLMRFLLILNVLISFREWLHSYETGVLGNRTNGQERSSHLFQRVASFLPRLHSGIWASNIIPVLISFREWLHSYLIMLEGGDEKLCNTFSSLSESGFIPTTGYHI